MGARREGRELALQALYAIDMNPMSSAGALRLFWEEHQASEGIKEFAELLVKGVDEHRAELDQRIKEQSKNWSLGRMAKVDLNILRIAVYELAYLGDIPRNVTINEAIEIAKKFGSEDSPSFVNGILDELAAGLPDKPNSP
ncbi:MAG: transcription antitermination factor NusB [Geobacter sp.]|nr:transcription antitermination factor NusB [Geobacter sp.]